MIVVMTMWLPRLACSTPGNEAPEAAEDGRGQRSPSGISSQPGRAPPCRQTSAAPSPPRVGLALGADVEQAGLEGERHREAREDEVGRVVEREAERLAAAEAADDQRSWWPPTG